jgi:hypothetical protein
MINLERAPQSILKEYAGDFVVLVVNVLHVVHGYKTDTIMLRSAAPIDRLVFCKTENRSSRRQWTTPYDSDCEGFRMPAQ